MPTRRPLRLFYAAGPGDVVGTFRHWLAGRDDPSEVAITYSSQFFDVCRQLTAAGYIQSYCPRRDKESSSDITAENRPISFKKGPAVLYHLAQLWSGLRMTWTIRRWKADIAIISGGAHWFALRLLPVLGVKVVPTLHCVLWRKEQPPRGLKRFIHRLDAGLFRGSSAVLSLSDDITQQLDELTEGKRGALIPFLPSYRREAFEGDFTPPAAPPFRVLFVGRIEANKGVFDLLAIARRFKDAGRDDIQFDLCGSGSVLEKLRSEATNAGVAETFRCHGHLTKDAMREMYKRAHVVIAPTTRAFIEGFNKVVAEAVLAGKPVITSSVCPALNYVRDAVVEVPPDDVNAYGDAILLLAGDPGLLESKRTASVGLREQFFDSNRSWGSALRRAVEGISNQ